MATIEQELLAQFSKLDAAKKQQVLDFVEHLVPAAPAEESGESNDETPWTEAELLELMKPEPKTGAEIAAWLAAHPTPGQWGDLTDDDDVAEYVHRMRREGGDWGREE